MPYIKETCSHGMTRECNFYYSIKYHDKKEGRREPKKNPSSEAQIRVNRRQAERKLTRILDANFGEDDWYITYNFRPEKRPGSMEELKDIMKKFMRKLRAAYKKAGKEMKYVWVAEIGRRGAVHIHMVQNDLDKKIIKDLWEEYGYIYMQPMWSDGNYRKLAAYFIKYSQKTLHTEGKLQGKMWNASRNLKHPEPKRRVTKSRDHFSVKIKVPAGWYLDKESVRIGVHELTGYQYFYYTLVRIRKRRGNEEDKYVNAGDFAVDNGGMEYYSNSGCQGAGYDSGE